MMVRVLGNFQSLEWRVRRRAFAVQVDPNQAWRTLSSGGLPEGQYSLLWTAVERMQLAMAPEPSFDGSSFV